MSRPVKNRVKTRPIEVVSSDYSRVCYLIGDKESHVRSIQGDLAKLYAQAHDLQKEVSLIKFKASQQKVTEVKESVEAASDKVEV